MGGEQEERSFSISPLSGSSPHGRGTVSAKAPVTGSPRFIPAWAGNRAGRIEPPGQPAVHPRMGGEQGSNGGQGRRCRGSSPHGRGTGMKTRPGQSGHRFIPAWAGNRNPLACVKSTAAVHPRMGGEQCFHIIAPRCQCGSSPHGRGTVWCVHTPIRHERFIPAWAGNSISLAACEKLVAVHPRMGGEQEAHQVQNFDFFGSSPHGRGTVEDANNHWIDARFIPAWAGNRRSIRHESSGAPVHPRMGGEQACATDAVAFRLGSSPHGRGTGKIAAMALFLFRFIPAWAGNRLPATYCKT